MGQGMTEFRRGDTVKVSHEGTYQSKTEGGTYMVVDASGCGHDYSADAGVTLTLVGPQYWPPQAGAVWQTEKGTVYMAQHMYTASEVRMYAANGTAANVRPAALTKYNPVLRYRQGMIPLV